MSKTTKNLGGPPKGNQNAKNGKVWTQAIKKALAYYSKEGATAGMELLARKLIEAAENGDAWALKELGDRMEGKPAQSIDMKVTEVTHEDALDALEHGSDSTDHHTTH